MMSMYERYAIDASESLFNSIYGDLYEIATRDNKARYAAAKRKRDYRPGEAQGALNDFCHGRMSIGHVLDFLKTSKALMVRLTGAK